MGSPGCWPGASPEPEPHSAVGGFRGGLTPAVPAPPLWLRYHQSPGAPCAFPSVAAPYFPTVIDSSYGLCVEAVPANW
ncbi:hypothetical protein SAMN05192558_11871 [Actinokineospora alba]|uniref:Uncharacterized protein n=1 Tax=Actinokineospora alba TaxID=504798 RepID=A0A1H0W8I2_9PSEU|nr:hypothetical protein C8E96_5583 [Actinokineospora alba]SDJ50539.1 hypothetical protein SAMN05421871_11771 [Actinokineospora alba]SDP86771.1 hypothetical protein SAMN05192558_11871 [Actinokineospora alba]